MNTITEELRRFVEANFLFGRSNGRLSEDASFLANGIIDSTGMLELIAFLEQKYGCRLEDGEIIPDNLDSLGKLTSFLERKLGQFPPAVRAANTHEQHLNPVAGQ